VCSTTGSGYLRPNATSDARPAARRPGLTGAPGEAWKRPWRQTSNTSKERSGPERSGNVADVVNRFLGNKPMLPISNHGQRSRIRHKRMSWGTCGYSMRSPVPRKRRNKTYRRSPDKCESLTYGGNGRGGETGLWIPRSAPTHFWLLGRPRVKDAPLNLVPQLSMRVQAPPSPCRSASVAPRSATGAQRSEAGLTGGHLAASIRGARLAGLYGQRK
jgi:hypothetical protein